MTHEPTEYETTEHPLPPLCLVHYFSEPTTSEHGPDPPPAPPKPLGRVAGRDGNLIYLEFAAAPKPKPCRRDTRKVWDALMLLLLLACIVGQRGSLSVLGNTNSRKHKQQETQTAKQKKRSGRSHWVILVRSRPVSGEPPGSARW